MLPAGPVAQGRTAGLKVTGARVTGRLDLKYGTVTCAVRLRSCHFEQAPDLYGARLGRPGQAPETAVLQLDHAEVAADVWAPELVAHGMVQLNGAVVGGQVRLDDAVLDAPGGTALHAEVLTVGTDLHAMRLRARGRVNLSGARIPRQLNLAYARLANPGGHALRVSSAVGGELWLREAAPVEGTVNLRRAQLDLLHVPPEVWPGRVRLDAYRTVGDDAAARTVQLAKLRRHRRTLPAYARLWGHLPALKPSEAPAFNPLFSTLDLLLPIISLNRQ
nr:hypothetical protein [Streptomyces lavendulae]